MMLSDELKGFLKSYGYEVREEIDRITFINSNYSKILPNVLLSLLGVAITILGIASAYKILLLFILLIFIPLLNLINNFPKEIIIDLAKEKIYDIDFKNVVSIRNEIEAQSTYATPFRSGTKNYFSKIIITTKKGNEYALIGLLDDKKDKGDLPSLLVDEFMRMLKM